MVRQIRDYDSMDDISLFLMMLSDNVSLEEKGQVINDFSDRLDRMDEKYFLQMLRQFDLNTILNFSDYVDNKIKKLSPLQLEKTLYENKYYHEMSNLTDYLLEQDWFRKDEKTFIFCTAHRLEKLSKDDIVSRDEVQNIGNAILGELFVPHDFEIFDMIFMNYMSLLEKFDTEVISDFINSGYSIINQCVDKDLEVTPNMIIFICHMLKRNLKLDYFANFFEFSFDPKESFFACHYADKIYINMAAVKENYEMFDDKKTAFQYLFFALGHELEHSYVMEYKKNIERTDLKEELRIHNACVALALKNAETKDFYLDYHDCFAQEFYANLAGIEMLYDQYKFFPCITDEDKIRINKVLAGVLSRSFALEPDSGTYLSPVDFTKMFFYDLKKGSHARLYLLDDQDTLSDRLKSVEKNLNEMEKFKLGYYNKYIGILRLLANGEISAVNIFDELPMLYFKWHHLVDGKYPAYNGSDNINYKGL